MLGKPCWIVLIVLIVSPDLVGFSQKLQVILKVYEITNLKCDSEL